MTPRPSAPIESVDVSAYTVLTDFPESDGTLARDSTTLVLVTVSAGSQADTLQSQLSGWVEAGIPRVKMKVGRDASADTARVIGVPVVIAENPTKFV
jgi:hypothetical protein